MKKVTENCNADIAANNVFKEPDKIHFTFARQRAGWPEFVSSKKEIRLVSLPCQSSLTGEGQQVSPEPQSKWRRQQKCFSSPQADIPITSSFFTFLQYCKWDIVNKMFLRESDNSLVSSRIGFPPWRLLFFGNASNFRLLYCKCVGVPVEYRLTQRWFSQNGTCYSRKNCVSMTPNRAPHWYRSVLAGFVNRFPVFHIFPVYLNSVAPV